MCRAYCFCDIVNVEQWRALKISVTGHSRSLKMSPFDRSCATSYQSAIVSMALSCTVFEIFDVEEMTGRLSRGHSPCEFMHELYRPEALFTLVIV